MTVVGLRRRGEGRRRGCAARTGCRRGRGGGFRPPQPGQFARHGTSVRPSSACESSGAPELSHADDGRTEVPWRANCPGCGGRNPPPRPRRHPVRAAQPRRLPSPRRLSPTTVMGVYFVELLGLMIFTDATAGVVLSLMFASLMLGLGIWIGFAWRGRV